MDPIDDSTRVDADPFSDIALTFSEAARILFSAGDVNNTLTRVVELAVTTIEGCDFAGVFLAEGGVVSTAVCTDHAAEEIDALQKQTGEGPCLDAIAQRLTVYANDLSSDDRWPNFGPQAAKGGMRSVLALPLTNGTDGAVNLYARYPSAFGVVDRGKAVILAALAGFAVSTAHAHEIEERRTDNLQSAMGSREIIGQAQGILMEREQIGADEAFEILRRASQYLNTKLREVAQSLVDTGERPDTGPPARL